MTTRLKIQSDDYLANRRNAAISQCLDNELDKGYP